MSTTIKAGVNQGNRSRMNRFTRLIGALLLFGMAMRVLAAAQAATATTLAVTTNGLSVSSVDAGAV